MKKTELERLNFKDFLPVVYEDLEPYLLAELARFREELIELPENNAQHILLSLFEKSVKNLNQIDQDQNIKSTIDTDEREGLCDALYTIGRILGFDENDDEYLDEWREW